MENIKSFDSFNEKEKWIKDAIKHPGSLRKSLKKKEGKKITQTEISSEISKLKKKDRDKDKPGLQLGERDRTKYKRLTLARTLKSMKESNEFEGESQNYMFFNNLQTIKRLVDDMLEMDEKEVDEMLTNGHNWALDHMATSKDDVEEVYNFLKGNTDRED